MSTHRGQQDVVIQEDLERRRTVRSLGNVDREVQDSARDTVWICVLRYSGLDARQQPHCVRQPDRIVKIDEIANCARYVDVRDRIRVLDLAAFTQRT